METRVLRYFLAVAREENISRAAEVLHITQPTLSRQLSQMEEELGVILFERGTRRIRLTDAGVLLRRRAEEIIGLIDKDRKRTGRAGSTDRRTCDNRMRRDKVCECSGRSDRNFQPKISERDVRSGDGNRRCIEGADGSWSDGCCTASGAG